MTLADAPALQKVYSAGAAFFVQSTGTPPDAGQASHDLAEAISDEGRHILGIYLYDEMVGVIDLRLAEPEPFDVRIGLILMGEPYRGQGLGSWALRILEAWLARDTPTEAVVVTVTAQDHVAQSFFLANDYVFTGQSTRVLIGTTRFRFLEMRKDLR